jgi:hypothetical protein
VRDGVCAGAWLRNLGEPTSTAPRRLRGQGAARLTTQANAIAFLEMKQSKTGGELSIPLHPWLHYWRRRRPTT